MCVKIFTSVFVGCAVITCICFYVTKFGLVAKQKDFSYKALQIYLTNVVIWYKAVIISSIL